MGDQDELNATFPVRPIPASTAATQTASCAPTARSRTYTGVNSPTVYRGDRLPAELYGNVFVAEPPAISSAGSS